MRTPFLSTVATCWPLLPPLPQATPPTPTLCAFSFFFTLPSVRPHTNTSPVVPDPARAYAPSNNMKNNNKMGNCEMKSCTHTTSQKKKTNDRKLTIRTYTTRRVIKSSPKILMTQTLNSRTSSNIHNPQNRIPSIRQNLIPIHRMTLY
mmetsp:Transcript_69040/g.102590  ORF Transcript_69040/g.102590 Transcript_69040/m.102590 type:complete len:148 (+) Transcript_69040:376-819(+)